MTIAVEYVFSNGRYRSHSSAFATCGSSAGAPDFSSVYTSSAVSPSG